MAGLTGRLDSGSNSAPRSVWTELGRKVAIFGGH